MNNRRKAKLGRVLSSHHAFAQSHELQKALSEEIKRRVEEHKCFWCGHVFSLYELEIDHHLCCPKFPRS